MSAPSQTSSPGGTGAAPLVDLQFIEARARLLDLASFLDRVQRHGQSTDYRVRALVVAAGEVLSENPGRARRILECLSDLSVEPVAAATTQGAAGAPAPAVRDATPPEPV